MTVVFAGLVAGGPVAGGGEGCAYSWLAEVSLSDPESPLPVRPCRRARRGRNPTPGDSTSRCHPDGSRSSRASPPSRLPRCVCLSRSKDRQLSSRQPKTQLDLPEELLRDIMTFVISASLRRRREPRPASASQQLEERIDPVLAVATASLVDREYEHASSVQA